MATFKEFTMAADKIQTLRENTGIINLTPKVNLWGIICQEHGQFLTESTLIPGAGEYNYFWDTLQEEHSFLTGPQIEVAGR